MDFFEKAGRAHREAFVDPIWNRYSGYLINPWDSLAIFLRAYAFGLKGLSSSYSKAAVSVLMGYKDLHRGRIMEGTSVQIWRTFESVVSLVGGVRTSNCPLYPFSDSDKQKRNKKSSVFDKLWEAKVPQTGRTLASFIAEQIKSNSDPSSACTFLSSIRGIGPRLASFYVRDLVDVLGLGQAIAAHRNLLQPADSRIRRIVRVLSGDHNMAEGKVASWIVKESAIRELNPERVNMGMWFFTAEMVGSELGLYFALLLGESTHYVKQYKSEMNALLRGLNTLEDGARMKSNQSGAS